MADQSKIEWTDATWNPVTGCTKVSEGCRNCYAETFAERFRGTKGHHFENGFDLTLRPDKLTEPLSWKKPRRVFVNSMSDLFHEDVTFEFIDRVFAVMNATAWQLPIPVDVAKAKPWHTYQILTKRPKRMVEYVCSRAQKYGVGGHPLFKCRDLFRGFGSELMNASACLSWPLPNGWLGVSVEDQATADERIPQLLRCPAALRFLSCEPLLGEVDLRHIDIRQPDRKPTEVHVLPDTRSWCEQNGIDTLISTDQYEPLIEAINGRDSHIDALGAKVYTDKGLGFDMNRRIDWVIVGGESGNKARECSTEWIADVVKQCRGANVPCFVKQLGKVATFEGDRVPLKSKKGSDPHEWPDWLRVREMPEAFETDLSPTLKDGAPNAGGST